MSRRRNPGDLYICNDCNHILKTYKDYEHHRAYFHNKDVEKLLQDKCQTCGERMDDYGCLNCWSIGNKNVKVLDWPEY